MRRSYYTWALILAVSTSLAWADDDDDEPVVPRQPDAVILNFPPEPEVPPPPAPEAKPGLIPGGVVDETWSRAFITNPDEKVEALDVKTGKTLFKSALPGQVMGVSGDRVYVLSPTIDADAAVAVTVRAMSIKAQGKYVFESKPLAMPEWIKSGHGLSLLANVKVDGGKVEVSWIATGRGGAGDDEMMGRRWGGPSSGPSAAYGTFTVDLSSGESKTSDAPDGKAAGIIQQMQYNMGTHKIDESRMLVVDGWRMPGRAKWIAQTVSHDGLEYSLKYKVSGQAMLVCRDPKRERTLWEREMATTPGTLPVAPAAQPLAPPVDPRLIMQQARFSVAK